MRQMSELSGTPIEPEKQTALLDACVAQPGVLGGGVPGGTHSHFSTLCPDKSLSNLMFATMISRRIRRGVYFGIGP